MKNRALVLTWRPLFSYCNFFRIIICFCASQIQFFVRLRTTPLFLCKKLSQGRSFQCFFKILFLLNWKFEGLYSLKKIIWNWCINKRVRAIWKLPRFVLFLPWLHSALQSVALSRGGKGISGMVLPLLDVIFFCIEEEKCLEQSIKIKGPI